MSVISMMVIGGWGGRENMGGKGYATLEQSLENKEYKQGELTREEDTCVASLVAGLGINHTMTE